MESNENFQKLIGKKLRTLRRQAGLSQRDLAQKLDLSHQQIHKYECGSNALPLERLRSLAEALGVTPNAFVFPESDLTGIEPAAGVSPDHRELFRLYDAMPCSESKRVIMDLLRILGKSADPSA